MNSDLIESAYTFEIDGQPSGYFLIKETCERIDQRVYFRMDSVDIDSRFSLLMKGGRIAAFRAGDDPWIEMIGFPEDAFPGCAYPVLIRQLKDTLVFQRIHEPTGTVDGWMTLERKGDVVDERNWERLTRRFYLKDEKIVRIDWGQAESILCASEEDARRGTPFELTRVH